MNDSKPEVLYYCENDVARFMTTEPGTNKIIKSYIEVREETATRLQTVLATLKTISIQETTEEMDSIGDIEYGYDSIIQLARETLLRNK